MKTFKNKFDFKKEKILFFILLCFQFSFANASVLKEDSLSTKFPLNDPRNPNCPCHKYQKLADDEFKKLLMRDASTGSAETIKVNVDKTTSGYTTTFSGGSGFTSINEGGNKKLHLRKRKWSLFGLKHKKGTKRKKSRRLRRDNTACFHF